MKYQSITNRDVKLHEIPSGVHKLRLRPAYLFFAGLATIVSLALWVSNPEPAGATRHVSLDLGNHDTAPATGAVAPVTEAD